MKTGREEEISMLYCKEYNDNNAAELFLKRKRTKKD
jgi:hypothetical protein